MKERETRESLPEYIKMYSIPRNKDISIDEIERYDNDSKQDDAINELVNLRLSLKEAVGYEVVTLIEEILLKGSLAEKLTAIGMIKRCVPEEKRAGLIRYVLENGSAKEKDMAVRAIGSVTREERDDLRKFVSRSIRDAFSHGSTEDKKVAEGMLFLAPSEEIGELRILVKGAYLPIDERMEETEQVEETIRSAPPEERAELIDSIKDKKSLELLIQPSLYKVLYKKDKLPEDRFSRRDFPKTGSETTLIGGNLKNKIIIRHINPEAFMAWKKSYENYEAWSEKGFDYVPIEPIQSYKLRKTGVVDVYSGVLDLDLEKWLGLSGNKFKSELEADAEKILVTLEKMGITHGHHGPGNFCLRFFEDEYGKPDLNKKPRIYLIDLDQATFKQAV